MRTPIPRTLAVCAALAVLVLTAGCTSPDFVPPTTSPVPSTSGIDEDQAVADATAALRRFYEVRNQCWADPQGVDSTCFDSVAVDQVLTDSQTTLENLRLDGLHYDGRYEVLSVEAVQIDLDGSYQQVRLAACVDQRAWRLVDDAGVQWGSLPDAPQRVVWQLINYDYPESDKWKVSYYPEEESASC